MTAEGVTFEAMVKPDPKELLAFYARQHHPTTPDAAKLQRMIDNTFCFVLARREEELIGFARGVTDGLTGRLAECKLDPNYQGPACVTKTDGRIEHDESGIARQMAVLVIDALRNFGVERIDAVAYGTEVDFCEELGFRKMRGTVALELAGDVTLAQVAAKTSTTAASGV
ncbi:MAG: GNAT family N-acetyltransferase [Phycisphaerae bacterium]|nr:GNAT family N-acetyltransferase [Phycisphaerae bacterium]